MRARLLSIQNAVMTKRFNIVTQNYWWLEMLVDLKTRSINYINHGPCPQESISRFSTLPHVEIQIDLDSNILWWSTSRSINRPNFDRSNFKSSIGPLRLSIFCLSLYKMVSFVSILDMTSRTIYYLWKYTIYSSLNVKTRSICQTYLRMMSM